MKKFLALVLAVLMALSCISFAGAETSADDQCTSENKVHNIVWTPTKAATCKEEGSEHGVCQTCKKEFDRVVPKNNNHTYVVNEKTNTTVKEMKPATCEEDGYTVYYGCSVCGQTDIKVVETALGHDWARNAAADVNATCTTEGSLAYKCLRDRCTATKTETVPALGHYWYKMNWEYTTEATETIKYVDAKPVGTPVLNGAGEKVINFHNDDDNPEESYYVDSTCTTEGKSGKAAVCDLCGTYYNGEDPKFMDGAVIPKKTHSTEWINQYVVGYNPEKNTCVAGNYYVENTQVIGAIDIPAAGGYGVIHYEYQPETCEKNGFVKLTCEACGWTKTIDIVAPGHNYKVLNVQYVDNENNVRNVKLGVREGITFGGDPISQVPFIVNAADYAVENLLDIGALTEEQYAFVIKVFKYFWQQNYVNQRLMKDCTEAPIVQLVCVHFGLDCEARRIDAAGWSCDEHDFNVVLGYRQKKATDLQEYEYNKDGKRYDETLRKWISIAECTDYTVLLGCEHCFQKTEEVVKGDGHDDYLETVAVLEKETCSKTGLKAVRCTECGYTEVVTVLPHKPVADPAKDKVIKNATCTEDGTMEHTCSLCGEIFTTVIPSAGHNWQHKVLKVASCTTTGEVDYVCSVCGEHKPGYPKTVPQVHVVDQTRTIAADNMRYEIDNEGHLTAYVIDCTKDGKLSYFCKNCYQVVITHKAAAAHNWEFDDKTVLPSNPYDKADNETCLHNFTYHYHCTECLQEKDETVAEKCEHVWDMDAPNSYIEPTATMTKCGEVGEAYYLCANCGEYYKAASLPLEHDWTTTWDAEKNQWTYTCKRCGVEKTAVLEAPKYDVDLTGVTFGVKTTGKGKIVLQNDTAATWILSTKYAYVRWTFKDGAGEDWVFDDVRVIDENGYFNANGIKAPAGATLHEFMVIITDDADADSKMLNQINRYGFIAK